MAEKYTSITNRGSLLSSKKNAKIVPQQEDKNKFEINKIYKKENIYIRAKTK